MIINRRGKPLDFFKINFFTILFRTDLANRNNLFNRVRFIADYHVSGFGVQKVLENATLVAVVIIKGIGLHLANSEVSEALEGDRKNKMDDHLPHLPSRDVEMADALIRICDTAGGFALALASATVEKLAYNAQRADHKIENRQQEGGKAY